MDYTWLDYLKNSSWVTIGWEWLQSLLGRAVDPVLWITMIFACYQLIPGAPMPPQWLSVFMLILQFVALDVGGMGLRQIAQRHGLDKGAFTYKIANACIGVTFITIIFAGVQHAMAIPQDATTWVEIILVIARSGLTVLYGQAIRALKFVEQTENDRVTKLEEELSNLRVQLGTEQTTAKSLQSQLQTLEKANTLLTSERDAISLQMDLKQRELAGIRDLASGGQDWAQQQLSKLQERLDSEHELTARLKLQMQSADLQRNDLSAKLQAANLQIEGLQKDLQNEKMQTAKSSVRSAKLPANITAIEDAKQRISNAEILAYIASHPDLKRSEVAANLGISERKVYDAISWGKEQDDKNAVSG